MLVRENILPSYDYERMGRFIGIGVYHILSPYVGDQITLSFDVRAAMQDTDLQVYPYQGRGISIGHLITLKITTDYQRIKLFFTVKDWGLTEPGDTLGQIALYDNLNRGGINVKNTKIELGKTDGIWTPAHTAITPAQAATIRYGEYQEIRTF